MKVDSDGYAVFYPLGTNKVNVPTSSTQWPKGNKFVSPFVYQDDKLVGFVDTKALTVSDNTTIYLPYVHIEAEFSAIDKGQLQIHAPNATTKKASWKDSGMEDIPEAQFKYKGCKNRDDMMDVNYQYLADDITNGTWSEPLWDLEQGGNGYDDGGIFSKHTNLETFSYDLPSLTDGSFMFYDTKLASFSSDLSSLTNGHCMFGKCTNLETFSSDLPSLTDGSFMFAGCSALTSFTSDLPSLTDGYSMFAYSTLSSFSSDLSSLTNGSYMFHNCWNLTTFTSDLSSLTDGSDMFRYCENLESFSSDLSSLTRGYTMFYDTKLASFSSDLSSLTDGWSMFTGCLLDTASVQHIADTINTPSSKGRLHIGIGNSTPNEQEEEAFNKIASKNWTVLVGVNGGNPSEWNPTSLIPIDGEEITNPIPFWAKPVQSDEKHAKYVDENGNFFNILGGNFIYGDDLSTYGMFISEEDAAANMRLTPYVKPQTKIENQ